MLKTSNSSIYYTNLNDNPQINDECMKSLGEYIKSNKSIKEIELNYNTISDTGIEILVPYLHDNTTFKRISLNRNKGITDQSISYLVKMIESSHIEDIDVRYTLFTQMNIVAVSLVSNTFKYGLTNLDLHGK